jgi:hypothetical protein
MNTRRERAFKSVALLLIFSLCHLSLGSALAAVAAQADVRGKLSTRGNQPISVNGIQTTSGATILTGASIETGEQVGATIGLGDLGSLEIAPNTKLQLNFSRAEGISVMLLEGCVILRIRQGAYGEINTSAGKATSNDAVQKPAATLDVCHPKGAPAAIVNQGAAANAGAGAGPGIGGGAGGTGGLNKALAATLFVGAAGATVLALIIANRGDDPSPSG